MFTEFPELAPSGWNGPLKVDNSGHNPGSSTMTVTGIEQGNEYPGSKAKTKIFEVLFSITTVYSSGSTHLPLNK